MADSISERPVPSREVQGAASFARNIRARRDLLQTLFYATVNSAADSWALHKQLQALQEQFQDGHVAIRPVDVQPRQEVVDAKAAVEMTAQDSAWALMLILDYSIQRFRSAIDPIDTRTIGPEIARGVKLNAAIWAFANQARHLHDWETRPQEELEAQSDVRIIRALNQSPTNPNASREVLCATQRVKPSCVDFEQMLLASAYEIIARDGVWRLALVSAGTVRLDPLRAQ